MIKFFKHLVQFIRWKIYDFRHPPEKRPYGITCYVGLPGRGKTLSLVEKLFEIKREFPKAKIFTNFGFVEQDGAIKDWHDLLDQENGSDGVVFGIDEVHELFNRKDWASMPPQMLSLFSQNRKHAKQFICTAQAYADIGIDLRRRCHFIIECNNFANRWILQRAFAPEDYKEFDGTRSSRHRAWRRSFIASNAIYESYDTYALINEAKTAHKMVPVPSEEQEEVRFDVRPIS